MSVLRRLKARLALAVAVLFYFFSPLACSTEPELNPDDYDIYYAPESLYGPTYYFKAKQRFILLAAEINIPLQMPLAKSILLFVNAGSAITYDDPNTIDVSQGGYQLVSRRVYAGDFNGDGLSDFLVLDSISNSGFTLLDGNQNLVVGNNNISFGSGVISVRDVNGDGRDDIVLSTSGYSDVAYTADSSGRFDIWRTDDVDSSVERNDSTDVGAIESSHNVAQDGSLNINVAIPVTTVAGGMQPEVGIAYNSNKGDGYVGWGWDISGLSSITRCAATRAIDGYVGNVDMGFDGDANGRSDKFCLDGQRLILVSGTYGAANSEYRTQSDIFAKIVMNGSQSFTAYLKDGRIQRFGKHGSNQTALGFNIAACPLRISCIPTSSSGNKVIEWMLSQVEDRFGNYRAYWYRTEQENGFDTAETYIKRIDYGGNFVADTPAVGFVVFDYQAREYPQTSYFSGSAIEITKSLIRVSSFLGDPAGIDPEATEGPAYFLVGYQASRFFDLRYRKSAVSADIYLSEIKECTSNLRCLPVTRFKYGDNPTALFRQGPELNDSSAGMYFSEGKYSRGLRVIDLNADGYSDLISAYGGARKVYLGKSNGTFESTAGWQNVPDFVHFPCGDEECNGADLGVRFGDFNGDGLPDLIQLFSGSDGQFFRKLYFNNGTTFIEQAGFWGELDDSNDFYIARYDTTNGLDYVKDGGFTIIDVNGDGRDDIVILRRDYESFSYRNIKKVFISGSSGFAANDAWVTSVNEMASTPHPEALSKLSVDGGVRFVELNGDGLPDIVVARHHEQMTLKAYINTGTGFVNSTYAQGFLANISTDFNNPEFAFSTGIASGFSQVADFNGDGLDDLVIAVQTSSDVFWGRERKAVYINDGRRFVYHPGLSDTFAAWLRQGNGSSGLQVLDITGDGRADLFFNAEAGGSVNKKVYVNYGDRFILRYQDADPNSRALCCFTRGGHGGGVQTGDFNGDGSPDLIRAYKDANMNLTVQTALTPSPTYRLLGEVQNGFGVKTSFVWGPLTGGGGLYARSAISYNSDVRTAIPAAYVVSAIGQSDGLGGTNIQTYSYKDKKSHALYGDLGFAEFSVTDWHAGVSFRTTKTQFYQDMSPTSQLIGLPKKVETDVEPTSGPVVILGSTTNVWKTKFTAGADGTKYFTNQLLKTTKTNRDLNGDGLNTEISWYGPSSGDATLGDDASPAYDAYGNNTRMAIMVRAVEGAANIRKTVISNTYAAPDTENWLVGLLTRTATETITSGTNTTGESIASTTSATLTRVVRWEYDALTRHSGVDVAVGRMTAEKIMSEAASATTPGTVLLNTQYTGVDSFGNVTATTVSGPNFVSRTASSSYSADGRFVVSAINALNHVTTSQYYLSGPSTGLLQQAQDPNGNIVSFVYDSWGRKIQETSGLHASAAIRPVDSYTDFKWCDYSANCPANAIYYIHSWGDSAPQSWAYVDAKGRTLRNTTQIADASNIHDVSVDFEFNNNGLLVRQSEPYFYSSQILYKQYSYDAIARPVTTTYPNGRIDAIVREGLLTRYIDGFLGQDQRERQELRDELGNVAMVKQFNGATEIKTLYQYDPDGKLVTVKSPASGGATTITVADTALTYDALGNKIRMVDPDKGTWSYMYNTLGEMVAQKNARGEVTCYAADKLGRKIGRVDNFQGSLSFHTSSSITGTGLYANTIAHTACAEAAGATYNSLSTAQRKTVWSYDAANGHSNIGRLTSVTQGVLNDASKDDYQEVYTYDDFGNATKVESKLNGDSYITDTSYDALNRADKITYPGPTGRRLVIKNIYDSIGGLASLKDDISNTVYFNRAQVDSRGNVTSIVLGGLVRSNRFYDPETGFINQISSQLQTGQLGALQNLNYEFDTLGNLEIREDVNQGIQELAQYDALNRLTTVTRAATGSASVVQSVTYDNLGNITSKTGVGTYSYRNQCSASTTSGPHAVCQISGSKTATYTYDANGNMTSGDGRTMTYTHFDKQASIAKGANSIQFKYGPDRELIYRDDVQASKRVVTRSVGGFYENVQTTVGGVTTTEERHYVGGNTIVTYKNRTTSSNGTKTVNYTLQDHIGSTNLVLNASGGIVEEMAFDPWGKRIPIRVSRSTPPPTSLIGSSNPYMTNYDPLTLTSSITPKGFTGHDQLDSVGLVHMKGRVYDPELGRFISADPFVESLYDSQALNRFSYVGNNPLSYTDPTGYFSWRKLLKPGIKMFKEVFHYQIKGLKKLGRECARTPWLQAAISVVVGVFCPPCAIAFNVALAAANGATIGQIMTSVAVGMVTAGIASGFEGMLSGVGGAIGGAAGQHVVSAASNMIAGGVVAKAMGGNFADAMKNAAMGYAITAGVRFAQSPAGRGLAAADQVTQEEISDQEQGSPLSASEGKAVLESARENLGIDKSIFANKGDMFAYLPEGCKTPSCIFEDPSYQKVFKMAQKEGRSMLDAYEYGGKITAYGSSAISGTFRMATTAAALENLSKGDVMRMTSLGRAIYALAHENSHAVNGFSTGDHWRDVNEGIKACVRAGECNRLQ